MVRCHVFFSAGGGHLYFHVKSLANASNYVKICRISASAEVESMLKSAAVESFPPLFIIFNDGSGQNDKAVTRAIIEGVLTEMGRAYVMVVVEDPRELSRIAKRTVEQARTQGGVVVAAGGDGTINYPATGQRPCGAVAASARCIRSVG